MECQQVVYSFGRQWRLDRQGESLVLLLKLVVAVFDSTVGQQTRALSDLRIAAAERCPGVGVVETPLEK